MLKFVLILKFKNLRMNILKLLYNIFYFTIFIIKYKFKMIFIIYIF